MAPAFTAAGGLTESVVRMKSAEFGWFELICHPGRISASTSSWLVAPGLSAPPRLSVSILTTSDGLGRFGDSCAWAACGHASRAAIAIDKITTANAPAVQNTAPSKPRLQLRRLKKRHRWRYRLINCNNPGL